VAPIDVRNPNATRFSLPGALIAAVDRIADPQDERAKLRKLEQTSKIESKRVFARNTLRKRDERARVLYGFGWGMLERASVEVTGCSIWEEKSFQTTVDVVARARLRVCESLTSETGSSRSERAGSTTPTCSRSSICSRRSRAQGTSATRSRRSTSSSRATTCFDEG
jgi:hypothetical protein